MHWEVVPAERYRTADRTAHYFAAILVLEASGTLVLQVCRWRHGQPMTQERETVDAQPAHAHARGVERAFELRDMWRNDLRDRDGLPPEAG